MAHYEYVGCKDLRGPDGIDGRRGEFLVILEKPMAEADSILHFAEI